MTPPPLRGDPDGARVSRRARAAGALASLRTILFAAGTVLIAAGQTDPGAAILIPAGIVAVLEATHTARTRWGALLNVLGRRAADSAVLAAVGWAFRDSQPRTAAAAVVALTLVLLAPYARVRAASLGLDASDPAADAIERATDVAIGPALGLALLWDGAEPVLWGLGASAAFAAARRTASLWARERAS